MYSYLDITIYVCNIINICNIYIYMYIQTQKSSKVKPHHPTDPSISRLWPTLPSELVLGRVGEKSLWPTLGEPGWWVNQCHWASSSPNLPPPMNLWVTCGDLGVKFNSQDVCCQSNFSSLKGELWLSALVDGSEILHQVNNCKYPIIDLV